MSTAPGLVVVAPCFNEGEVAVRFVRELEAVVANLPVQSLILLVDDASMDDTLERLAGLSTSSANVGLEVLSLRYNTGHQQAIYQGLLRAHELCPAHIVVMDSDGEDDPAAIPAMWTADRRGIVLVNRGRRKESWRFKLGYAVYRRLFRIITGRSLSFGNYSMIDGAVLEGVIDRGFVHYAAFLSKLRVPVSSVTFDRRQRLDGRSKMSFKSLSIHAFRSLIEYSDEVLELLLKAFFGLALLAVLSICYIVSVKLFTSWAIPGWASILSVSLINSTLLCLGFFSVGLLLANSQQRQERARKAIYRVVQPRQQA
ncbi:MAG: glycosyltransferase [Flavobacteriales bacterium]|nr:glycosyltransferase [Flavobacteriales bacterium]